MHRPTKSGGYAPSAFAQYNPSREAKQPRRCQTRPERFSPGLLGDAARRALDFAATAAPGRRVLRVLRLPLLLRFVAGADRGAALPEGFFTFVSIGISLLAASQLFDDVAQPLR